jgi:hypothetical protein
VANRDAWRRDPAVSRRRPGPLHDHVGASLVEQGQHRGQVLGLHLVGIALQRGHAGCRCGIDDVVLAPSATRELSDSGGRGRRHVIDDFLTSDEPLGKVTPQPTRVLDRPATLAELVSPAQQPAVTSE